MTQKQHKKMQFTFVHIKNHFMSVLCLVGATQVPKTR